MVQILNRECSQKIDRAELSRCVRRIDLMLPAYRYGLYNATKPASLAAWNGSTAPSLRRPVLEHSMIGMIPAFDPVLMLAMVQFS
jgi:hypothetical protein